MIIYRAASLDGMFRVEVVEFRSGWRVYTRLNNGHTETMPFPRTHHAAADVIDKARRACQIFAPMTDGE